MVELDMNKQEGIPIEDCSLGNHHIKCFVLIDLGIQSTNWGPKHKIKLGFETHKKIQQGPEWAVGKPFGFYLTFSLSKNPKSSLMQFLTQWIPDLDSEIKKHSKDGKLQLRELVVGRYGTGSVGKQKWSDGNEHVALTGVFTAMDDHPSWETVNGPEGTSKDWRYPRGAREQRANALEKPVDYPNDFDKDQEGKVGTGFKPDEAF